MHARYGRIIENNNCEAATSRLYYMYCGARLCRLFFMDKYYTLSRNRQALDVVAFISLILNCVWVCLWTSWRDTIRRYYYRRLLTCTVCRKHGWYFSAGTCCCLDAQNEYGQLIHRVAAPLRFYIRTESTARRSCSVGLSGGADGGERNKNGERRTAHSLA